MKTRYRRTLRQAASLAFSTAALAGCGGGSSSSVSPGNTATVTGVAAQGTPMAGALVTLTDATGQQTTTTADANGNFSFAIDLSKFSAPFGLEAADPAGATENQESVLAAAPAVGGTAIANITPLTSAVAAGSLASGSPYDVAKPAVLSTVTAADIKRANDAIVSLLANVLADAKVSTPVDLIATPFTANHTGIDQVLDEVLVVPVGTSVELINKLNVVGSNQVATIAKSSVSNIGAAFTVDLPSRTIAPSAFDSIKSAWLACFAASPSIRLVNGMLSPACQAAVSSNPVYLRNGYSFAQDYANWLSNAKLVNPTMIGPTVMYADSTSKVLLHFALVDSDGAAHTTNVVAQQIGGQWQVTGNQDPYDVSISGELIEATDHLRFGPAQTNYSSGLLPIYRAGSGSPNPPNTQYVVTTGPGMPAAGVVLAPNPSFTGMRYWPIANQVGAPASSSSSTDAFYGLATAIVNGDGSASPQANPTGLVNWQATAIADFTQFAAFPRYTFVLHFSDGTTATVYKRLLFGPIAPSNGAGFVWDAFSTATLALLSGTQSAAGSMNLAWTAALGAPQPADVIVTAADGTSGVQNSVNLAASATSATVDPPSGIAQFPAMSVSSAYRWFQLDYRTPGSVSRYNFYGSQ